MFPLDFSFTRRAAILLIATISLSLVASAAERPNILFVVADDMSHTSIYGHTFLNTPNFDSIARQGLRFNRMYTPSSKCAPSRAVLLTGRNPWQLEGAGNHKPIWPAKFKSVVEALAENGYFAGYTGKGWDPGVHPKGRSLTGQQYNQQQIQSPPTKNIAVYDYAANFQAFMNDKPSDQPFFFWYGCKEPHRGYEYQSGVKAGKDLDALSFQPAFWPASDSVKHDVLDYAVEVEYFDEHLGRILEHLGETGELDKTLIIATSDNSMPFPRFKGHPHEYSTRIPFVVKWHNQIANPGRECNEFASFIDLAPTLLDISGIDPERSGMQPMQGKSLTDFFAGHPKGRDQVLTGRERNDMCRPNGWGYPVRSIHRGNFVYMHNFEPSRWPCGTVEAGYRDTDGSPTKSEIMLKQKGTLYHRLCFGKRPQAELYNVQQDPDCVSNLADHPQHASRVDEMKTALFDELMRQGDPRLHGDGDFFDSRRPERHDEYRELVEKSKKGKR